MACWTDFLKSDLDGAMADLNEAIDHASCRIGKGLSDSDMTILTGARTDLGRSIARFKLVLDQTM